MLWVLLAAVLTVLLIACANVANLLLARGESRSLEVAVSAALGATSSRIATKFLLESLLLCGIAMAAGVMLARVGLRGLLSMAPAALMAAGEVSIDARVLGFALVCSALVAGVFSLVPTLQARRVNIQGVLKEGRTQAEVASSKMWLRRALVTGQMALAVVLVVGAVLLIGTLWNLQRVDPDFVSENLLRADFQLPSARYPRDFSVWPNWPEINNFHNELESKLESHTEVISTGITSDHPLSPGFTNSVGIAGRPYDPQQGEIVLRIVTPGYFETVGLRVVRGRAMNRADNLTSGFVAVLNQAATERYFPEEEALGQSMILPWTIVSAR